MARTIKLFLTVLMFFSLAVGVTYSEEVGWRVEVGPQNPLMSNVAILTLSGQWGDSCVPTESEISLDGNNIYFDIISDMSESCFQVITPFELTGTVELLLPGTYQVYTSVNGDNVTLKTDFYVVDHFEARGYRVMDLGPLDCYGQIWGINDSGQVVGGYQPGADDGFIWDSVNGKTELINAGYGHSINNLGQVAGCASTGGDHHAYLWESDGEAVDLGTLPFDNGNGSRAYGINDQGQIVGKSYSNSGWQSFVWDSTNGMVGITSGRAFGINNAGQVVGSHEVTGDATHAYVWDSSNGLVDLGTLDGEDSEAFAINDLGQVVGESDIYPDAYGYHAFIWDEVNGMVDLGTLGGDSSVAVAINNAGQVVGHANTAEGKTHPFIWDSVNGMVDLNNFFDEPIKLGGFGATGINNKGQIIGFTSYNDESHALVMTPINVVYVDADATGANDGSSWADAFTSLPYALSVASNGDEIRVAQGINKPNDGLYSISRELSFVLKNGVTIKGGYAGFGETDPDECNVELYETILSGDLNGDDGDNFANNGENSYTVVFSNGTDATAVLDGFTITGGNANGSDLLGTLWLNNGGGMYIESGSATLINCTFMMNNAACGGGGLCKIGTVGDDLIINNCRFISNRANIGGGICDSGSTILTNCLFNSNSADGDGGGIFYSSHNSQIINCTITGNSADFKGGGIFCTDTCVLEMTNSILWNNTAEYGPQIYSFGGSRAITYCDVQGGCPGEGNIDTDPLFADPDGADNIAGTEDDNLRLLADSLCIDAGDNSAVTATTDLDGNERIVNNFVDMGAYEFGGVHMIYVDDDAANDPGPDDPEVSDPDENGTEAHPFDTIQEAVDIAKDGHTVLTQPGLYVGPDIFIQAVSFDKNITLTSIAPTDWDVVEDTIIAGNVSFSGTEDSNCILTGFKVHNLNFGAILGNGTHATISNCIISGNGPCQATVINDFDGLISNCLITDNTTFAYCGIFPIIFGCNGLISNCTIANNISGIGDWEGGSTTLQNCIIYNNGDVDDPQIGVSGGGALDISYCNIQGGQGGVDSDGTVNWGWGNIDVDPCFVRLGQWNYDPLELAEGNYRLKSFGWRLSEYDPGWTYDLDLTSRCIDAGNPGSPLADELMSIPREDPENYYGINLRVNMGAYGGTPQASMAPYDWALLGDLNNDGVVNYVDLAGQAEDWLTSANEQPGDLNRDGIVNMVDFAALAEDWLQATDWAD